MLLSDWGLTFRTSLMFPSSRVEDLMIWHILPLKMSPQRYIETSSTSHLHCRAVLNKNDSTNCTAVKSKCVQLNVILSAGPFVRQSYAFPVRRISTPLYRLEAKLYQLSRVSCISVFSQLWN